MNDDTSIAVLFSGDNDKVVNCLTYNQSAKYNIFLHSPQDPKTKQWPLFKKLPLALKMTK